ncbi:UPF0280 family protein [Candidatus Woesearchaeota archaeon]|nr:UPF0280 family protein [Candidatus Woesearchaeota archaeon]
MAKLYLEELIYKHSRIKILVDRKPLIKAAYDELIAQTSLIESYIKKDPLFLPSLKPYSIKKPAPEIVKLMAEGADIAGVGPMAAVAGTIAEFIAKKLIQKGAKTAVVENGGDIFAIADKKITIGLFSGNNKIAEKLAFTIDKNNTPLSICSSSSLLGHSISFGNCDLSTVFSRYSYIADAAATALGNRVKKEKDIQPALDWVISLKGVKGALLIKGKKIGMIGDIPRLYLSDDKSLKDKVTKEDFYRI